MTHEYVIATNGVIHAAEPWPDGVRPSAVAWAADHVLAVGSDVDVRSISRGDSTFLDLDGCTVTALPHDVPRAKALVAEAAARTGGTVDVGSLLLDKGLLDADDVLGPGSRADLAFWRGSEVDRPTDAGIDLIAVTHGGAFTEGDEHRGPFLEPA